MRRLVPVLLFAGVAAPARAQDLTVGSEGARFRTIQSAVDAAKNGDVIAIAPGTYEEQVTIRKALTLRGAGFDKTILTSAAASDVLVIQRAKDVVIEKLKVASRAPKLSRGFGTGAVIAIAEDAEVEIRDAVVCGGPGNGIAARSGAVVVVRRCLVAGVGGVGLLAMQGRKGRVHVLDSELRNCVYVGVRTTADTTTVERCRISGSKWHGIRYDNCAPKILSNVLFDNERTAIYGSGKTRATVLLNLFLGQSVTCWFQNQDTITGNTFVGVDSGVAVLGASRPVIRRNVFHGNRVAIRSGGIGGGGENAQPDGEPILSGNVFWRNEKDVQSPKALNVDWFAGKLGNVHADPGFTNARAKVYVPKEDSAARRHNAGVRKHVPVKSPWPAQPEETERGTADSAVRRTVTSKTVATKRVLLSRRHEIGTWIKAVTQTEDKALRARGIAEIRKAIGSEKIADQYLGLNALIGTRSIEFERKDLRARIEAIATADKGELGHIAAMGLLVFGNRPRDIDRVVKRLRSCDSRELQMATHTLRSFGRDHLTKDTEKIYLALLDTKDDLRRRAGLRVLRSRTLTPAVEKRLLEMASDRGVVRGQVFHFVINGMMNLSKAMVDLSLEEVRASGKSSVYALGVLTRGIPAADKDRVVQAMIATFPKSRPNLRPLLVRVLEAHASSAHLPQIELLDTEDLTDRIRRDLARALKGIRKRIP